MDFTTFNHYLQSLVNQLFPEPQASLLNGILLGVKNIPKNFEDALKITGTIHVVVVSGYNLSVVGGFFSSLAGTLKRQHAVILALTSVLLYALLVGLEPPVVRAALMATITYLSVWLGKQRLALWSLVITGLVMILFDIKNITNLSFQLSFLATLGIIVFSNKFSLLLKNLPDFFRESLATTLAAQLLVLPVIFYHFGTLSLISPLVNALVLWTIPFATILGFITLLIAIIFNPLAQIIAWVTWVPLSIFIWVVEALAKVPLAQVSLGKGSWLMAVGWYLMVLSVFIWLKNTEENSNE